MTYVITEPCVDVMDLSCVEPCPVDCIYVGASMLYIHPDECVDCDACLPVCPVEAIYEEDDVPIKWAHYTNANADFFSELGSPGGASRIGPMSFDAPQVRPNKERVVQTPMTHEDTELGLLNIVRGDGSGHVIALPKVPATRATPTAHLISATDIATYLLFGDTMPVGERIETGWTKARLDKSPLSHGLVSLCGTIESADAARSAELLQDLLVKPQSKAIKRITFDRSSIEIVLDRARVGRVGMPEASVQALYDTHALGLVVNLIPLLLRFVMWRNGGNVHLVTSSFEYASFIQMAVAGSHFERTSAFDAEIVLPDLSGIPKELLANFRHSYEDELSSHVVRMADLAKENAALEDPSERRLHWGVARKEIADHGSKLWRLARTTFPGVRGDVALGITGGFASLGSPNLSSVAERLFTATGLAPSPVDPAQIFFLTRLKSECW